MSKIFLIKIFSPPVRTLHRLGIPSRPILSHHSSQEQGRRGGSQGRPSPRGWALSTSLGTGIGQGWDRRSGCLGASSHVIIGMVHLRVPHLWASPELAAIPPKGGCSQRPHSPLTRQVRISGDVFLFLKGEEGKAFLMPYLLVITFPLRVIFVSLIHSISEEEWEDCKVAINRAENMEENKILINCQNYAAMSPGIITVMSVALSLITKSPSAFQKMMELWDWHMSYLCHSFTSERETG